MTQQYDLPPLPPEVDDAGAFMGGAQVMSVGTAQDYARAAIEPYAKRVAELEADRKQNDNWRFAVMCAISHNDYEIDAPKEVQWALRLLSDAFHGLPFRESIVENMIADRQRGGEPVGEAGTMPGTNGFTMAVFKAEDVPVGTKVHTAPQPVVPVKAQQCSCKCPHVLGVVHRVDSPCFLYEEPAEQVKELSAEEVESVWADIAEHDISPADASRLRKFARALLARYGSQPTKPVKVTVNIDAEAQYLWDDAIRCDFEDFKSRLSTLLARYKQPNKPEHGRHPMDARGGRPAPHRNVPDWKVEPVEPVKMPSEDGVMSLAAKHEAHGDAWADAEYRFTARDVLKLAHALHARCGQPTIPEGWKLVPVEPTSKQIVHMACQIKGSDADGWFRTDGDDWLDHVDAAERAYKWGIESAPTPSNQQENKQ